jgi:membrane protein
MAILRPTPRSPREVYRAERNAASSYVVGHPAQERKGAVPPRHSRYDFENYPYNPEAETMESFLKNFFRGIGRVFPGCLTLSQAIAFNMFLAFFPILLLILGILSSQSIFHNALREVPARVRMIVPPGSEDIITQYFVRQNPHPWKWFLLGLAGTLLAGSQVMVGFMEAFRGIEADEIRPTYWRGHFRALLLLLLTLGPALIVVILTVFGKQARAALIHSFGLPALFNALAFAFQAGLVFILSMVVLVLLYRVGRPGHQGWLGLLPGAVVATIMWWTVDIVFGFYVRKMPYDVVYGGLAAAIGLLIWMYLTALVVLLGAAFNAEWAQSLSEQSNDLKLL